MNNQQELPEIKQLITEEIRRKIDGFLTAKRRAVVFALAEYGEHAHGDLAVRIESTVTSLANIIQKFEQFQYQLLESERAGKYRIYRLSELGKAYVEGIGHGGDELCYEDLDDVERKILQEAETSLACFKERYRDDDWQTKMDDALLWRIRRSGYKLEDSAEKLVNRYLICLEHLTMRESYAVYDKVLVLLESEILRKRVNHYMKQFKPFILILQHLKDKPASFDMRMMLKHAFSVQSASVAGAYIEAVGWNNIKYDMLKTAVENLLDFTAEYDEKQIFLLFQGLLPGLDDLSFYLAQLIHCQHTADEAKTSLAPSENPSKK